MTRLQTPRRIRTATRRGERNGERGQILVLFTLAIVVIFGLAAMAIDVGVLRNANQHLWNALDAGALAGAPFLPEDPAEAEATALQFADANFPGGLPSSVTVEFRCVIGSVAGAPRIADVPSVCDPGPNPVWSCNATICAAICVPGITTSCNAIVLQGTATVPYVFGRAVGVDTGTTQTVTSAACAGGCGTKLAAEVDLVVVVDRTSSMNGVDTDNARFAADAVRKLYNPAEQWMAFGMLGPSVTSGGCVTVPDNDIGTANIPADLRRWIPIGLTGTGAPPPFNANYAANGSAMFDAIDCYTNSSVGTDLTDPIPAAAYELIQNGRPGVTKGIILMSDGQPNNSTVPDPDNNYCAQSFAAAQAAKAQGIELFTIGFGLDGVNNATCPDETGFWSGKKSTALLAAMATDSLDDHGCPGTENDDLDHFFCLPKSTGASANLANLFKQAANQLVGGTKLIPLP